MSQNQPEKQWSEGEDSSNNDSVNSVNSEQVKNRISLSNTQMRQLSTDDNKFFKTIKETNDKAVERIHSTSSKQALIYLGEAERILEYGACCGKVIDRNLIICVLHNEAAAYQRIWALDKCSKYIEAVIYNIEVSLTNDAELTAAITFSEATMKPRDYQVLCSVSKRKLALVQYYLQYCAIMSQQKNHELALSSSFKAVSLMKELLSTYYKYYKAYALEERSELMTYAKKLKMLRELSNYKQDMSLHNYESILQRTRWVFKEWRANKNVSGENEDVQNWIKTYSIGNAMQMQPFLYSDYDAPLNFKRQLEQDSIIRKVLLFAISYFTVATEIRLIEVDKYPNNEQQKRKSEQFQRSQLFHLTSIKIFCTYVPYESMFIKHVLHSYSNHYKPQLNVDSVSMIADDQFDDPNSSTTNQSKNVESQSQNHIPSVSMSPAQSNKQQNAIPPQQSPIHGLDRPHMFHNPPPSMPDPPQQQSAPEEQSDHQPSNDGEELDHHDDMRQKPDFTKFKKKKLKQKTSQKGITIKVNRYEQVEVNHPHTARSNLHSGGMTLKTQSPRMKSNTMFSNNEKPKKKVSKDHVIAEGSTKVSKVRTGKDKERESVRIKYTQPQQSQSKGKDPLRSKSKNKHKMRKPAKLTQREPEQQYFPRKENKSKSKKIKGVSSKKRL